MTATQDTPVEALATTFSSDIAGLDECVAPTLVDLAARRRVRSPDRARCQADRRRPGPHARLQRFDPRPDPARAQGSEISVQVRNDGDTEATVHWHGLRLDNKYDGVPYETQDPIADRRRLHLPGCASPTPACTGTTRTSARTTASTWASTATSSSNPPTPDYWPPVNREFVVTLDDVLVEDGHIAPSNLDGPTHVAMGRFGNVMLTGGETNLELDARAGEVVRFYFTNTANTRLFNVALPGARMKLVGSDSGRYEHETFVDDVLLAPSERAIVDVLFDSAGLGRARAPHARPHLHARHHRRQPTSRSSRIAPRRSSKSCARATS